ncbi:uncharacterized protein [Diadema setosum]|uniref:uncharacterized protein n=1 Tax=Diadema setosum TaxID=31175 RepID=UPI003B3B8E57
MIRVLARLRMGVKGNRGSLMQERKDAEKLLLQLTQRKAFCDELQQLTRGKQLKGTSRIHGLDPYVDEAGMLRVGGRLKGLAEGTAHPIILPKHSPVTRAIVRHFHQKVQHQGRGITQNEIRSNGYWIVNGSKVVTDLVRNCVPCRRLRRPGEEQKMANLPEDRTEPTPSFTNVGMDCFGPFTVKRGLSEIKRYGLIFTCFCSRGVHIEMLDDMSTDSFINALRCFIARCEGHIYGTGLHSYSISPTQ